MIRTLAEHRVAANLGMIMMILAGLWTIRQIPTQLDPPMDFPVVWIDVVWRGASAEDIEQLVTIPIEQQLRTLTDLEDLSSRTENGRTHISVELAFDADRAAALDEVKQRIAGIRNLPAEIEPPLIRRYIDLEPVATVLVTGSGDVNELIPVVRGMESELIARGVEAIYFNGLPEEEIALLIGGRRLTELGLTLTELGREVARVSRNVPAGHVGRGHGARQLRSLDQRREVLGFEQLYIETGDALVRLGNIAEVVRRPRQGQPIVTRYGKPAIEMTLFRSTGADAYHADQVLDGWLEEVEPTLPPGVELTIYNDIWKLLSDQLRMVGANALSGLVLVLLTLYLFLSARVALWVAAGIPVSFLAGLAIFHGVFGFGISIIALLAFIMALGIVVDDAIVVGEDTMTQLEHGTSPLEAAVGGARRMWVPVATSSATTLAAFIPLLLIGGALGQAILALPAVLFCVIVASLVECFVVLPGHLKASLGKSGSTGRGRFGQRFDDAFQRFRRRRFAPLARRALDYPGVTLCASLGAMLCAVSLVAAQHVGVNLVTGFSFESVEANVEFGAAASEADRDAFLAHLESTLDAANAGGPDVLGFVTRRNLAEFNDEDEEGGQFASVEAQYAFAESRSRSPADFVAEWRSLVERPPFVERLTIDVAGGVNGGRPDMTLVLRGDDVRSLKAGAEALATAMVSLPGVSNVHDNLPYGREQLIFSLTATGRLLGLTPEDLGAQLRSAYNGELIQIFNQNEAELEVRAMLPDRERRDLARLTQFPVRTPGGEFVPLGNVATLYNRRGIDIIRHNDGQLAVRVSADVDPDVNNSFAVIGALEEHALPEILGRHDLTYGLAGRSEADRRMLGTFGLGAVLTLALIYLILAWVFESYLWPLAIMTAIPFGLTGAVVGHAVMGIEIGAMSMLAFFSLSGIVVNDGIVLISFFKHEVETGTPLRDALEHAVDARFRAVLLTSLTTIAGLATLLFDTSTLSMYTQPIATTMCFGLAFSTLLVLLVIPALILLLEGGKRRLRARITGAPMLTTETSS